MLRGKEVSFLILCCMENHHGVYEQHCCKPGWSRLSKVIFGYLPPSLPPPLQLGENGHLQAPMSPLLSYWTGRPTYAYFVCLWFLQEMSLPADTIVVGLQKRKAISSVHQYYCQPKLQAKCRCQELNPRMLKCILHEMCVIQFPCSSRIKWLIVISWIVEVKPIY